MEQEFNKGDCVTFHAFAHERIKARVTDILRDGKYRLEGAGKTPLLSETTGRSIEESQYFVCPIKNPFKW